MVVPSWLRIRIANVFDIFSSKKTDDVTGVATESLCPIKKSSPDNIGKGSFFPPNKTLSVKSCLSTIIDAEPVLSLEKEDCIVNS